MMVPPGERDGRETGHDRADLQGTWNVVSYLSREGMVEPSSAGREPAHLIVDGSRIAGTMGVNRLMGQIGVDGLPGPLATTLMAGPPEMMEQEATLLELLQSADEIVADEKGMTWSKDGLTLVEFQRSGTNPTDRSSQ